MIREAAPTGTRGRQPDYSDATIQTCLTLRVLFGMALRRTTGSVESFLRLIGPGWAVPDFSTLSRRQKTLKVDIPDRGSDGPLHLLVDSSGIKVEGEGAWNARKNAKPWKPDTAGPLPATTSCAHRSAPGGQSGGDGAAITVEAAQRRRCTATSCWRQRL